MNVFEWISRPWPWYVAGPMIGLTVPLLLLLGNKKLGVSSSMRHVCAACLPAGIPFFKYNWKQETWNLMFAAGIIGGGFIAATFLQNPEPININPSLMQELQQYGISDNKNVVPSDLFSWQALASLRGITLMIGGGFLVGFGTRYAGGCTSGHSIMGLSNLQWPSLVATICFMAGGFIMTHTLLSLILSL